MAENTTYEVTESLDNVVNMTGPDPSFIQFRDVSRFWVQRVLLPFIVIVGFFGNAVTIVVLTRRGMRSSTNTYLTALAIADLLYLLCVFWLSLMHYSTVKQDAGFTFYWYTWPYGVWLTDASTNTSVWLTVTFTVERYIAVCHPMRGKVLCTESRARRVIVAVFVVCFSSALTTLFEWTVTERFDNTTNITRAIVEPSWLAKDDTYRVVYYWFSSVSFVLLPLTLLIIFNSFLIQSVRQSQRLRRTMTRTASDCEDGSASNEIRITITLIAVVMLFVVCQLPTAATLIYTSFHEARPNSNEEVLLRGLGNIFNLLVTLNAASNFILYCALSDKYRRTFIWTFCRCWYRAASPQHSIAFYTQQTSSPEDLSRETTLRLSRTPSLRTPGTNVNIHRTNSARSRQSSYLALPMNSNGGIHRQSPTSRSLREMRLSPSKNPVRSASVRVRNSTLKEQPRKVSAPAPSSGNSATKWWQRRKSASPNPTKTNILIQISNVDEADLMTATKSKPPDEISAASV